MSLLPPLDGPLRLPVVAAPMFLCSGPALVTAQCQSGIVGSFPALNARSEGELGDWIDQIGEENAVASATTPGRYVAPFAVNLIAHRSNYRFEQDLDTVVRAQVPIVITSLGARPDVNEAIHAYGGVVLHDVVSDEFARKAIEKGADGLIAVAVGAGGHGGSISPLALVQELRAWFDGPLLLSGAIAHGRSILAAMAAGADLAYVGSAFLATREANTSPSYKQMIIESSSRDIVYSASFTGIPGNYLRGRSSLLASTLRTSQSRAPRPWSPPLVSMTRRRGGTSGVLGTESASSTARTGRRMSWHAFGGSTTTPFTSWNRFSGRVSHTFVNRNRTAREGERVAGHCGRLPTRIVARAPLERVHP